MGYGVGLYLPAGLTVDNVRKALREIHWYKIGEILRIPNSKLREIEGEYPSDEEREVAVIRYWILRDPFASWRRIIDRLTDWGKHYHCIGIRHYSEELTGMCTGRAHVMYPSLYGGGGRNGLRGFVRTILSGHLA